jgi:hypothetical protein
MEQLNLELTLNQNGSITANWSEITGATRYKAVMHQTGKSYVIYIEQNLATTSYTSEAGLKANEIYEVVVAAYNNNSVVMVSEGKTILIHNDFYDNLPLEIPQDVSATPSDTSVTVSWKAVTRASGYDVRHPRQRYDDRLVSRQPRRYSQC